mmetsp:Transcript_72562/g.146045  ORF Transcript_72562/g.146045 Transcript_72562/m.146045 type:complete len:138 (+) Transcript_72562:145-558(+)
MQHTHTHTRNDMIHIKPEISTFVDGLFLLYVPQCKYGAGLETGLELGWWCVALLSSCGQTTESSAKSRTLSQRNLSGSMENGSSSCTESSSTPNRKMAMSALAGTTKMWFQDAPKDSHKQKGKRSSHDDKKRAVWRV